MRREHLIGLMVLFVLGAGASEALGQDYRPAVMVGYSAPLPGALRGEMTSSPHTLGSASRGGPVLSVSIERGGEWAVRAEALYVRHSSPPRHWIGMRGIEMLYAAEREETVGGMASLVKPVIRTSAGHIRAIVSAGVLRTRLAGHATLGGDAGTQMAMSHVAPSVGAGLELPVDLGRWNLLFSVRAAQLVSDERGGGSMSANVGLLR